MGCQDCKHFYTSENYDSHLGWCKLSFPPWFYKVSGVDQYEVNRTVRKDHACAFLEVK